MPNAVIHFLSAIKYLGLLATITFFVYCSGCKEQPGIDEHPVFVSAIYKRMDTLRNKYADAGLLFVDSAFSALNNPGPGDIFVKDSIKQSKYIFAKHDYIKANACLDSMMAIVKDRTNEERYAERYATVLYEKGECFMNMKRYDESFHYISMAEEASLKLVKNKCSIVYYSSKKAYLMFVQEKYLESIPYFKKQYQLILLACDQDGYRQQLRMGKYLNNIGLAYLRAGLPDSAAWYQRAALNTIVTRESEYPRNKADFVYSKGVIYGDQAEVLMLKGKYGEAEETYKKSIEGTRSMDIGYTQSTQARLAAVYLKDHQPGAANLVLQQLKSSLDTVSNEQHLLSWYKLSVKYFTLVNRVEKAFTLQQQYQNLRDAAEARDKKFVLVDIGKEFENMELRYANELLQKEDKLKTIYLIIAFFIFILVTGIIIFAWYNLKRTRGLHLEVQQKNENMQKAFSSLEQSHLENNRIIRIVAHDLKKPVSNINNLIFSMLRRDLPEDLKETFELIKKACSNSMMLINDALLQQKKTAAIRKELVDMKRLLKYCVDLLQLKAAEKNQYLQLHAEDISIMLNRQKMWRVISNIVNNAIKFSPENSVIDIRLTRKKNSILLSVHDMGIGIPVLLKDKIFTMSPEASRTGTLGEESYGLGLSISSKIVEEHDGKIWFESNTGKGSVFFVELPSENYHAAAGS